VEDSFLFNANFSSPLQKIKIYAVAARVENGEERKGTQDRVDDSVSDGCVLHVHIFDLHARDGVDTDI